MVKVRKQCEYDHKLVLVSSFLYQIITDVRFNTKARFICMEYQLIRRFWVRIPGWKPCNVTTDVEA